MAQDQKLHKLDDLFRDAKQYTKSSEYLNLIKFCQRMRHLGPYNAMLANMQMPGAKFLLTATKWRELNREVKCSARPVVILMPFSPVDFVFDLSDTVAVNQPLFTESDTDILERIKNQFNPCKRYDVRKLLDNLQHNMRLEGICVERTKMGTESAGRIWNVGPSQQYNVDILIDSRNGRFESAKAYYLIEVSQDLKDEGQLLTFIHELGHLYCHHIEHPSPSAEDAWHRARPDQIVREFEAQSVAEIVFDHFGFDTGDITKSYLANYLENNEYIPKGVSPDSVFSAAGKIIQLLEHKLNYRDGMVYKYNQDFSRHIDRIKGKAVNKKNKQSLVSYVKSQALFDDSDY